MLGRGTNSKQIILFFGTFTRDVGFQPKEQNNFFLTFFSFYYLLFTILKRQNILYFALYYLFVYFHHFTVSFTHARRKAVGCI